MTRIPYRGAAVTLLLLVILLTPPEELLTRKGAYADTRADIVTTSAIPVELRDGLRSDPGDVVPGELGNWTGRDDPSWERDLREYLKYDSLLVREYTRPGFYVPVQVMILTARHAHAFHNPEVCFTVQGGNVSVLNGTRIPAPAAPDGSSAPVGRLLITYPETGQPAKLVYNLYVVERHDAAADRTTWIRLSLPGVDANNTDALEPYLLDLMSGLAPYLFHGTGTARTTAEWVANAAGWPAAIAAGIGTLVPVAAEGVWLARRRKG